MTSTQSPSDAAMHAGMARLIHDMMGARPLEGSNTLPAPGTGADGEDVPGRHAPEAGGLERSLRRGSVVGRLVVLHQLGAGGMGVVHAAYDPKLDRKVALKVLRPGREGHEGRARMLREAQAMAKIAHPNVVGIHDVGTVDDEVWVAMELIEGQTLGHWLKTPRGWRETLDVMCEAGRGLAAAHAAGLLHRDFKPGNVMVGNDGRARVMDFGLARARRNQMPIRSDESVAVPALDALDLAMTHKGVVLGTPAYMPPEQYDDDTLTVAGDQFAFCVTLWEALYGERPFEGDTGPQLLCNALAGRLRPPPKDRGVPSWLRRACERGLSATPSHRWASMDALLEELCRPRSRPRRHRGLAFALALCLGVVASASSAFAGLTMSVGETAKNTVEAMWSANLHDERGEYETTTKLQASPAPEPHVVEEVVDPMPVEEVVDPIPVEPISKDDTTTERSLSKQLVSQGRQAFRSGQRKRAKALFEEALERSPKNHAAFDGLSCVEYHASNHALAVEHGKKAVALKPERASYHLHLGDAYFKVGGQDDARQQYRRARDLGSEEALGRLVKLGARLGAKLGAKSGSGGSGQPAPQTMPCSL